MSGRIRRLGRRVIANGRSPACRSGRIAVMSSATSSAQSMRQQLDDLDALLQRMLALPTNQLDEPPPAPLRPEAPLKFTQAPRAEAATSAPPPAAPVQTPPRMRLLTDSSPVPPPAETEPIGY